MSKEYSQERVIKKRNIPLKTSLGENLKYYRRLKSWTQGQLAEQLEVTRNNISTYESGNAEPSAKLFIKMAEVLDVPPLKLLLPKTSEQSKEEPSDHDLGITEDVLKELSIRNQEMTKIYDGYRSYQKFQSDTESADQGLSETHLSFYEDFLKLLGYMIQNNNQLLNSKN